MFLFIPGITIAQISEGGIPPSFKQGDKSLPSPILVKIKNNSERVDDLGMSIAGYSTRVDYDVKRNGTLYEQHDGGKIWKIRFQVPEAYSLMFLFDQYQLPEGAKLFIYSSNREIVRGAFTSSINKSYGRLTVAPITGNDIVIEYFEPSYVTKNEPLHISKIAAIFPDSELISESARIAPCHNNVMCSEGEPWCNQRRSVARIMVINELNEFVTYCTGSLITKAKRDFRPYFLTAFHCLDVEDFEQGILDQSISTEEQNMTQNWVFTFNYQRSTCSNSSPLPDDNQSISGAYYRASNKHSDFALLELTERPPGDYNVYYNGFDNRNRRPSSNGATIHHPLGVPKKISFYEDKPTRKNFLLFDQYITKADTWKVFYTDGVTEGGSSGAPFYNGNKLLVGNHSGASYLSGNGAPSLCNGGYLYGVAGRFDKSWDKGGSSHSRVQNWLDPADDGLKTISGDDPCSVSYSFDNVDDLHTSDNIDGTQSGQSEWGIHTYNGVYEATETITSGENVTIQETTSVVFDAGQEIYINEGFHAEQGSNFHAKIEGCLEGCGNGKSTDEGQNGETYTLYERDLHEETDTEKASSLAFLDRSFIIYPNPTSGVLHIKPEGDEELNYQIEIIDVIGRTIYTSSENNAQGTTIDISGNASGIYFLKIKYTDITQTKRIVLNN